MDLLHPLLAAGLIEKTGGKKTGRWLVNYWEPHWRPPVLAPA